MRDIKEIREIRQMLYKSFTSQNVYKDKSKNLEYLKAQYPNNEFLSLLEIQYNKNDYILVNKKKVYQSVVRFNNSNILKNNEYAKVISDDLNFLLKNPNIEVRKAIYKIFFDELSRSSGSSKVTGSFIMLFVNQQRYC